MRENKYDTLLNISIVILIVSAIMLGVTGYNIFFKGKPAISMLNPSKRIAERDSLQSVYSSTLKNIDNSIMAGNLSADQDATIKLREMSTLRTEIDSLLKQHGSEEDLATAKIKIGELQQKVAELQNRYTNVESENRRLQALINKLISGDNNRTVRTTEPENTRVVTFSEKNTSRNSASVGFMHLFAVTEINSKEQETIFSEEAEKLIGSFSLKNLSAAPNAEVVLVVLQPDGKVVKNSVWETGTFDTRDGKKVYSRKFFFDPEGDEKQLNFSLTPDKFLRGDYTMQIWYNGNMMAKMVKTLS